MLPLLLALAGCAPRYSGLPPLEPEGLSTPLPAKLVRVGDIDINTIDSGGEGRPVVLVHGLSSSMGFWEYQVPALAERHRVLAVDLPGYGASSRPDAPYTPPWFADVLVGWMDEMGLDSATFVGHSMGGQVALTLAIDHPERVDALVLSAPAGFERFQPGHAAWMKDFWTERRALETSEEELRATFTTVVFNKPDEGVERLLQERVRMGRTEAFKGTSVAVSRSIAGMLDFPVLDRLDRVSQPTLVVFGSDDRMIPNPIFNGGRTRSIAEAGVAALPDAELVMVPRAGHTVHHDAPEAFNRAALDFLDRR